MKFTVTLKDPDCLAECIRDAVMADVVKLDLADDAERDAVADMREAAARDVCATWFEYGEYLEVEIDTEAKTATVLPR